MNTVQNAQVKRSIRVKDFLNDFQSGMHDEELLERYHLTPTGLERFYDMLQERAIISPQELLDRYSQNAATAFEGEEEEVDSSSFICPSCLASHKTMFDICPNCGVSFQEMISREDPEGQPEVNAAPGEADSPVQESELDTDLDEMSASEGHADPIEISEEPEVPRDYFAEASAEESDEHFVWPGEMGFEGAEKEEFGSEEAVEFGNPGSEEFALSDGTHFDDPSQEHALDPLVEGDEVVVGLPEQGDAFDDALGLMDSTENLDDILDDPRIRHHGISGAICESCDTALEPVLRDIYDRTRGRLSLMISGILFVLGFLGSAAVSFFDGYSLGRLVVVYGTGMFLLFGTILAAVGAFMYLAREKAYFCSSCRRIYPRG